MRPRQDSISYPKIIWAGDLVVLQFNADPTAEIVDLSQWPAPVKTPAGIFVAMQNFNTEHGLTLSVYFVVNKTNRETFGLDQFWSFLHFILKNDGGILFVVLLDKY